jgi:hypothetical protein
VSHRRLGEATAFALTLSTSLRSRAGRLGLPPAGEASSAGRAPLSLLSHTPMITPEAGRLCASPPTGHHLPTLAQPPHSSIDIIKKQSGETWASPAVEPSLAGRRHSLPTHSIDIIKKQSGETWAFSPRVNHRLRGLVSLSLLSHTMANDELTSREIALHTSPPLSHHLPTPCSRPGPVSYIYIYIYISPKH